MTILNKIVLRSQKLCASGRTIAYTATMKPGDGPGDMGELLDLALVTPKPARITDAELSELRADALAINKKPAARR